MKECQYCFEQSYYSVFVPWTHSYVVKNKEGKERTLMVPQTMKLHLCAYHYDKWRSQNESDL